MKKTWRASSLGLLIMAQLGLPSFCEANQCPEPVNCPEPVKYLQLWNKLGSDCEVAKSKVGVPGVKIGDLYYQPGYAGNGFRSAPRTGNLDIPNNYIEFRDLQLAPKGEIEFWYTPSWSDYRVGHVVDLLYYGLKETPEKISMSLTFNDWQDRGAFNAIDYDTANRSGAFYYPGFEPQWTLNKPIKITMKWDGGLPDGTIKTKLLFNDTIPYGFDPSENFAEGNGGRFVWNEPMNLYVGSRPYLEDWQRHNWEPNVDGVIDELKVWGYTTPPVANAGPDQTTVKCGLVKLDGSNSFDCDGDPLTYSWELIGKPVCSEAKLRNRTTAFPSFVADQIGLYTIKLIVNDGHVCGTADIIQVCAKPLGQVFTELEKAVKNLVKNGVLTCAQGNALTVKLEHALAKLAKNPKAAINLTNAFVHQVEELITDGVIPIAAGGPLLDLACGIIDNLKH